MRKFLELASLVVVSTIISVVAVVFILEWMAGCGEHYVDSNGETHINQCLFLKGDAPKQ